MLAKQVWWIASSPSSLLSSLLKHKYFPDTTIFEAQVGNQASYTWRSITDARQPILAGSRGRIASGKGVKICGDRWLPRPLTFQLVAPPRTLPESATVDVLITASDRRWNENLICEEFIAIDAECITSIPSDNAEDTDLLIWHFEENGQFSVCSAYHLMMSGSKQWATPHIRLRRQVQRRIGILFGAQNFPKRFNSLHGEHATMHYLQRRFCREGELQ